MTIIYMYQAALYCEACGKRLRADLDKQGKTPEDPDDERTYDSDDYPKECLVGESDSVSFCEGGADCADAIDLAGGRKIGCWLEEDLTDEGVKNLQESLSNADLDPALRKTYKNIADCHNVDYLTDKQIEKLRTSCRFADVRSRFKEPCLNCRKSPDKHDADQHGYCNNSTRQRDVASHLAEQEVKKHQKLADDLGIKYDKPQIRESKDERGKLAQYSSVGGYTIGYYTSGGDMLCAECAEDPENDAEYVDVYYEGPTEFCAGCNKEIESAYGDPDAERGIT
ncbi:MAG: hypothetical protein E6R03_11765 [Hyphomicrobiaceae bacterium]|nr:MAG: hypothetical protein E6R03_11765 [Hyphomicrobiaceae bacterium]